MIEDSLALNQEAGGRRQEAGGRRQEAGSSHERFMAKLR
jgi:hypothetical protein